MNISEIRHPKESIYLNICIVVGALCWVALLFFTLFFALLFLLPIALFLWISEKLFQASIYGNSVHVNRNQYKEIYDLTQSLSEQLKLKRAPEVFIVNSSGLINAVAVKFLSAKYVLLYSNLVDLLLFDDTQDKLRAVIAHELAHHAAGHMSFWKKLLIKPAMFVPFLGAAYKRSCELTADRIAAEAMGNETEMIAALMAIAAGSSRLIGQTAKRAFSNQENKVPSFFGFLREILSSHPRMTKRIIALNNFSQSRVYGGNAQATEPVHNT